MISQVSQVFSRTMRNWNWQIAALLYEDGEDSQSSCHFTLSEVHRQLMHSLQLSNTTAKRDIAHKSFTNAQDFNFTQALLDFTHEARSKFLYSKFNTLMTARVSAS